MMHRRKVIKGLLVFAGGITFLPSMVSCRNNPRREVYKNFVVRDEQFEALSAMVNTIIPTTDTPGAKELGVHLWLLKMLDDCYDKQTRDIVLAGLDKIDHTSGDLSAHLQQLETKEAQMDAKAPLFYKTVKKLTIRGYLSSEHVMTKILKYEMVPGRWHGKVAVKHLS